MVNWTTQARRRIAAWLAGTAHRRSLPALLAPAGVVAFIGAGWG
jgi:hypothetical protein